MYAFLQQFFQTYEKYAGLEFFAFGESYAGHYIPAVTHAIWQHNQDLPTGAVHINLVGTSVGNGLTNPEIQYQYYPAMAVSTNGHKAAVSTATHALMEAAVPACVKLIKACQTNVTACLIATDLCNIGEMIPYTASGMNPYDMRIKCAVPPLCYDFSNVRMSPTTGPTTGPDLPAHVRPVQLAVHLLPRPAAPISSPTL